MNKKKWRETLFEKQRGLCHYCGKPMSLTNRRKNGTPARNFATIEHLRRKVDGGQATADNIVLAHAVCNLRANTILQGGQQKSLLSSPYYHLITPIEI